GSSSPELTTIVSVDPIYASFSADEELVTRLLARLPMHQGAPALEQVPVEITAAADDASPIRGKLQLIDNEVDRSSGTIRVRAVFDNTDGRLIPGQFVRIRVGEPTPEEHLLVSEQAIGTDQDKKFVMVVGDDNVAAYRPVELGARVDGDRIIESGIAPGERVVVNGLQRIRPGMTVAPEDESKVASQ
ncbi:MAG: efflux RND transporter periplasmic adaptor subunit, partial [Rhizobiaceae bacterium]|nr:efflux RND transporter periplasmic adaptor subunit [Rhizobiaceae bacterium]